MTDKPKVPNGSQPPEVDLEKLLKVNQLFNQTLGDAVGLMTMMPAYQHWRVADLKARLLPAIALRQCRIFRHKGFPVAFVSWAWLSDEIDERVSKNPELPLSPREWRSGQKLRFIDIASPKGDEQKIEDTVRQQLAQAAPGEAAKAPVQAAKSG